VTPSKVLAELPVSAPIAVPPSSIQAVSAVVVPTAIASGGTIAKNSADTAVHHAVTDSKLTEKIDTPSVTPSPENFVIQVGAFSNAASAHKMLGSLKEWSFKAYSEKSNDKIRVRVGPYSDKEKANKVKLLLEKHGLHPTIIPLA
jgi:DedD protein